MMKPIEKPAKLDHTRHLESRDIEEDCGKHRVKITTYDFVSFEHILTNTPHSHDYYEICLVLSGSGTYRHNGQRYNVLPGSLILAERNSIHELSCYESRDLEIVFFFFNIEILNIPLSNRSEDIILSNFLKSHKVHVSEGHILFNYLPLLMKDEVLCDDGSTLRTRFLSKAITTRAWFFDSIAMLTDDDAYYSDYEQNNRSIDRAVSYIMENIDRSIKVADVAGSAFVSERHLRSLFDRHYGMSVTDFIQTRKVQAAESKLRMGYKASEAAAAIGIFNSSQFSKLFKKVTGFSPNDYSNLVKHLKH